MLIDTHCHLNNKKYDIDLQTILDQAKLENVEKFITISTNLDDCNQNMQISNDNNQVFYSVGVYPNSDLDIDIKSIIEQLENNFLVQKNNKLVAIGECGIDININDNHIKRPLKQQIVLFEEQIKLSIKYKLPIIIHNRNADDVILKLVKKYAEKGLKGIFHCFDSTWEYAKKVLELGFLISFSGMVTFKNKFNLHEVARNIDLKKIIVETDSPYLSPEPLRGQINYPKNVVLVAKKIAQLKNDSYENICNNCYLNTLKLFNL